jgi:hypothetical protein
MLEMGGKQFNWQFVFGNRKIAILNSEELLGWRDTMPRHNLEKVMAPGSTVLIRALVLPAQTGPSSI